MPDRLVEQREETERIALAYRRRQEIACERRYAWHRAEVRQTAAALQAALADLLPAAVGEDLGTLRALDVGCGGGSFLRLLVDWGADPAGLAGTELIAERLQEARRRCPIGPLWHLGPLASLTAERPFQLVSAFTVFSSILDAERRRALAAEMWRLVAPGGAAMIFDFRRDNPRNPDVRKVLPSEARGWWPDASCRHRTLVLAPPLARRIAPRSRALAAALALLPPLRSHFLLLARKPGPVPVSGA